MMVHAFSSLGLEPLAAAALLLASICCRAAVVLGDLCMQIDHLSSRAGTLQGILWNHGANACICPQLNLQKPTLSSHGQSVLSKSTPLHVLSAIRLRLPICARP